METFCVTKPHGHLVGIYKKHCFLACIHTIGLTLTAVPPPDLPSAPACSLVVVAICVEPLSAVVAIISSHHKIGYKQQPIKIALTRAQFDL